MRDVYIFSRCLTVCSAESALLHIKIDESLINMAAVVLTSQNFGGVVLQNCVSVNIEFYT